MTHQMKNNATDVDADYVIETCLSAIPPKSFFLYAGAGSGKTRSLVTAVEKICETHSRKLALRGQQVAVITYTNAACEEILQRIEFNPQIEVRTIHSFCWNLLNGFNDEIKEWLKIYLAERISELELAQQRGRSGQASIDRPKQIASIKKRIAKLPKIKKFVYSPTGDNNSFDSLNHSEVIGMTSNFLEKKPGMQRLLASKFPILLIDESQDTNRLLMESLLLVQKNIPESFCLGLFGDTMQRIYNDGKVDLAKSIPQTWDQPVKDVNYRCPQRVVTLINRIRSQVDEQQQRVPDGQLEGCVRLFILPESVVNRSSAEKTVLEKMALFSKDTLWTNDLSSVKVLTLEHHMAARRFGFFEFFEPFYNVSHLQTGFIDGTLPGISFLRKEVLPVIRAIETKDKFALAAAVRRTSPFFDRERLATNPKIQSGLVRSAKNATDALWAVYSKAEGASILDILQNINQTSLFRIPDTLVPFLSSEVLSTSSDAVAEKLFDEEEDTQPSERIEIEREAWRKVLSVKFAQFEKYDNYVQGVSIFATHQGVKGLEFPRVMVIISDEEAKGFNFSYEKLFEVKVKSKVDLENEVSGKDTTVDRTRRLFYVTCSRACQSLAIICYSSVPNLVRKTVVERGWFDDNEVITLA